LCFKDSSKFWKKIDLVREVSIKEGYYQGKYISKIYESIYYLSDSQIEKAFRLQLEVLKSGLDLNRVHEFYLYAALASTYTQLEMYTEALDYAFQSDELKSSLDYDPELYLENFDIRLTNYLIRAKKYRAALAVFHGELLQDQKQNDRMMILVRFNEIGLMHYKLNEFDSAEVYFQNILDFHENLDEPLTDEDDFLGVVNGNLGMVYYSQDSILKAIPFFLKDYELSVSSGNLGSAKNVLGTIASSYLKLNQFGQAEAYSLKLLHLLLIAIYEKTGQTKKYVLFLKRHKIFCDSLDAIKAEEELKDNIITEMTELKVNMIEKDLALSSKQKRLTELHLNEQRQKTSLYSVIFWITTLFFLSLMVYICTMFQKRKMLQQSELQLIQSELVNKKQDLTNILNNISFKRQLISDSKDKLLALMRTDESMFKYNLKKTIQEFNHLLEIDKEFDTLQLDFENVNTEFFKKLKQKYPNLSDGEVRLCALLRLKLTVKNIALIRNIAPESVQKAKQRIRRKMELSKGQSINDILDFI
jgi:tetratricopeptide (TPR) repeat protein